MVFGVGTLYNEIHKVSEAISNSISKVNTLMLTHSSSRIPIHAIFYPSGVKLLLSKVSVLGTLIPQTVFNVYDLFPLLLAEAGIVRGVRYKGKRTGISADGYLRIEKLETGTMHQDLYPTFITWGLFKKYEGSLEEGAATYLLMHIPRLLILKHFTRKFKASILYPSPFTAMSTYAYGRSLMLTPFSSHVVLDFEKCRQYDGYLLGYAKMKYIEIRLNFVIYNPHGGPLFQLSTQFPATIPSSLLKLDASLKQAYEHGEKILVGITGFIEGTSKFVTDLRLQRKLSVGRGRVTIIGTIPLEFNILTLFSLGNIMYLQWRDTTITASISKSLPYKLSLNKDSLKEITSRYLILKRHLKRDIGVKIAETQTFYTKIMDIARKNYWFCIDTDKMHVLAPLMLSFHAFHRRDPRALLDILECSCIDGQEKTMKLIELNQRYKEKGLLSLPVLVRYKYMAEAWHTATTEQKMLIEKYRLAQTF